MFGNKFRANFGIMCNNLSEFRGGSFCWRKLCWEIVIFLRRISGEARCVMKERRQFEKLGHVGNWLWSEGKQWFRKRFRFPVRRRDERGASARPYRCLRVAGGLLIERAGPITTRNALTHPSITISAFRSASGLLTWGSKRTIALTNTFEQRKDERDKERGRERDKNGKRKETNLQSSRMELARLHNGGPYDGSRWFL